MGFGVLCGEVMQALDIFKKITTYLTLSLCIINGIQARVLDDSEIKQKAMLLRSASMQEGKDTIIKACRPFMVGVLVIAGTVFAMKKGYKSLAASQKSHANSTDFEQDWIELFKEGTIFCGICATAFFSTTTVAVSTGLGLLTLNDGIKKLCVGDVEAIAARLKQEQEIKIAQIEKKREEQRIERNIQRKRLITKKN